MTRITPLRLITLHLLQIFFTDGLTFIFHLHGNWEGRKLSSLKGSVYKFIELLIDI
jgi:hypothetical protein